VKTPASGDHHCVLGHRHTPAACVDSNTRIPRLHFRRFCVAAGDGSFDRLVELRLAFNGGERCIAQLTQDVVGAPTGLACDREASAVVVDASGDLEVVVVVGGAAARRLGGLEQRLGVLRAIRVTPVTRA
jgi:hypothetical protein